MEPKIKIGDKVNKLTVEKELGLRLIDKKNGKNARFWLCRCECGNTIEVRTSRLTGKVAISCGCVRKDALLRYAKSRPHSRDKYPKEYTCWANIKNRVFNPDYHAFKFYSKVGMSVEWAESFEKFLLGVGEAPKDMEDASLDRVDTTKGYFPGNVRWATKEQQSRNQRLRSDNKSGVSGVRLDTNGREKWIAYWYELDGKQGKASFAIEDYSSSEEAFNLACAARRDAINRLNKEGAGYSETHGVEVVY